VPFRFDARFSPPLPLTSFPTSRPKTQLPLQVRLFCYGVIQPAKHLNWAIKKPPRTGLLNQ
jgi:hypothetical protein